MMFMDSSLSKRLLEEKTLLFKYASWCQFFESIDGTGRVEGWTKDIFGQSYKIQIQIGPFFPHVMPHLFVVSPLLLRMREPGRFLNDLPFSHSFHVYGGMGPNKEVEICYTNAWDPSHTIMSIVIKSVLWINAYALYLRKGKDIHTYLKDDILF